MVIDLYPKNFSKDTLLGNWASVDHLFMEQKDVGITMVISNVIVWINQKNLTIFFITIF
jgi:hypothetical protein